ERWLHAQNSRPERGNARGRRSGSLPDGMRKPRRGTIGMPRLRARMDDSRTHRGGDARTWIALCPCQQVKLGMAGNDAFEALDLRAFIDGAPALAWSGLPDGSLDFFNQRFLEYTRLSLNELRGSAWRSSVHRDDIGRLEAWWQDL